MSCSLAVASTIDLSSPVDQSIAVDMLHWSFNESGGAQVANSASTGSGYDGTATAGSYLVGNPPERVPGPPPSFAPGVNGVFGNAIYLPGAEKPNINSMGPNVSWSGEPGQDALDLVATDFTGGVWIKLETASETAQTIQIFQRGTTSVINSFWVSAVRTRNGGAGSPYQWKLQMGISGATTGSSSEVYETGYLDLDTLMAGEWNHIGFSFDYRGDEEGDLKNVGTFYLNGEFVESFEFDLSISVSSSQRKIRIGERNAASFYGNFDGYMDDFFLTSGLHTFQPIPEPGTAGLMLGAVFAGGALLGARRLTRSSGSTNSTKGH